MAIANRKDDVLRDLGKRGQGRKARDAEDIVIAGIDRVQAAGIAAALEIGENLIADSALADGGAHDGHRPRRYQRLQAVTDHAFRDLTPCLPVNRPATRISKGAYVSSAMTMGIVGVPVYRPGAGVARRRAGLNTGSFLTRQRASRRVQCSSRL